MALSQLLFYLPLLLQLFIAFLKPGLLGVDLLLLDLLFVLGRPEDVVNRSALGFRLVGLVRLQVLLLFILFALRFGWLFHDVEALIKCNGQENYNEELNILGC